MLPVREVVLLPAASEQSVSLPALLPAQASLRLLQVVVGQADLLQGGIVRDSTARTPPEVRLIFGCQHRLQMGLFVQCVLFVSSLLLQTDVTAAVRPVLQTKARSLGS